MRRLLLASVVALAAGLATSLAMGDGAAGRRSLEQLAFIGDSGLGLMNSDGTNVRWLVRRGNPRGGLSWSPDGRQLAFFNERVWAHGAWDQGATSDLYVVNAVSRSRKLVFRNAQDTAQYDPMAASWSPDGSRLALTSTQATFNIWLVAPDGRQKRLLQDEAWKPRWSPDGSSIAFISSREGKKAQIFLIRTDGGEAIRLTDLPEGSVGEFRWSPDSSKIAFTFRPEMPTQTEAAKKEREDKGLSEPPIEIDHIWYRLDGDGYFAGQRYAIHVVDVATKECEELYGKAASDHYSFDWSPNSKELIVSHTASKRPFAEPPNIQLYRVDLEGQAWQLEGLPAGEKDSVRWSPDGTQIARR